MANSIEKFVDKAMFEAEPIKKDEGQLTEPKVFLLWMTPDPLGAIAAMCRMYEGSPTYNLKDIPDSEKFIYFNDAQKTHLKAPLEAVKLHFFIEGVDRSFTHQMVRQRTAVYAQESMRFAVKRGMATEALVPPSIVGAGQDIEKVWQETLNKIQESYDYLIANGIPAEDARGILPHVTATRLNYVTDLRSLSEHAGNRLCTQAQFMWRKVFLEIIKSIAEADCGDILDYEKPAPWYPTKQGELIAKSSLFRPACYQVGHCPFNASFDRGCTIRERVEIKAAHGVPSSEWNKAQEWIDDHKHDGFIDREVAEAIRPEEWMLDPRAAWVR